ncbi:ABC transporter ATP-binding protein C-terminal domain-containing protein [Paraburkholderia tropica]
MSAVQQDPRVVEVYLGH